MDIDDKLKGELEKRAQLFDEAVNHIKDRIQEKLSAAREKLKIIEKDLMEEVEAEFSDNPFSSFLSESNHTDAEIRSILSVKIPDSFGPDEEAYNSLFKEIKSLKSWREYIGLSEFIPKNVKCTSVGENSATIAWDHADLFCTYGIELKSPSSTRKYHTLDSEYTLCELEPETEYQVRVRTLTSQYIKRCLVSDPITVKIGGAPSECAWKECPSHVEGRRKYSVDEKNPKIAKMDGSGFSTIIGSEDLPPNKVTSWSIKVLNSKDKDGGAIYIGVAPSDIDQNKDNRNKCGWYFYCYQSTLYSGPPHNYTQKEYGPKKGGGKYVRTGDSVGVVMDTTKGELSFILNGVNLGVAYEGIPLDKPLVPCVILGWKDDYIELIN